MTRDSFPVFAISGSDDFRRRRDLDQVVEEHRAKGWRIDRIDGASSADLRASLSQNSLPFMVEGRVLVVVDSAEKSNLELLEGHTKETDTEIVVLLHQAGDPKENTKFGKFLKKIGKQHRNHPAPKDWDADKVAVDFVMSELRSAGKTIEPRLAAALVARVGTDLGFLSFELRKLAALADSEGASEIDAARIKGGIAPLAEAAVQPVIDALARKDAKSLAGHLDRLKRTSKGDQTIKMVRILFDSAVKWLAVSEFRERGVGPDAAAAEMGVNPWFWRNKVVPQAGSWTRQEAARLIKCLAGAERAVLSGQINPWVILVASLMDTCKVQGR